MTTVAQFSATVQKLIDTLTVTRANILNSWNRINTNSPDTSSNTLQSRATIETLNQQAAEYDRQFEEAQYKFQASGGKSRKQTLQEFVILFFFVGYALFTISLILYGQAVGISTAKIFGGMLFLLLIITGIIVRYA
jgi:hypothetical protein